MSKQSSVEWLISRFSHNDIIDHKKISGNKQLYNLYLRLVEQAKEMEKQQIIDAAERWKGTDFAEKYYAETYGSKGSDETLKENHIVDTNEMIDHIGDVNEMVDVPQQNDVREDDVEKLVMNFYGVSMDNYDGKFKEYDANMPIRDAYVKGYNKAKEKYRFTEEDMRKALSESFKASQEGYQITTDEIIQSLSQPKMPIGFKYEMGTKYYEDSRWETHPIIVVNQDGQNVMLGEWIY